MFTELRIICVIKDWTRRARHRFLGTLRRNRLSPGDRLLPAAVRCRGAEVARGCRSRASGKRRKVSISAEPSPMAQLHTINAPRRVITFTTPQLALIFL